MKHIRIACVVVLVAAGVTVAALKARSQSAQAAITGPSQWVGFEADFVLTAQGVVNMRGHIWRGADGSMRRDSYAPQSPTPDSPYVVIFNIGRRTAYYLRPPKTSWDSYPLQLPAKGYQPTTVWGASMVRGGEIRNGFQTVERTGRGSTGGRILAAPGLNFFPLLSVNPVDGLTEEVTNVKLTGPAATLFEPPDGAVVEWHTAPKRMGRFESSEVGRQ